jgi:hypothetical protein
MKFLIFCAQLPLSPCVYGMANSADHYAQYSVILNGLDCLGLACEVIAHITTLSRLPEAQGRESFSARIWRASTGASATPVWLAL